MQVIGDRQVRVVPDVAVSGSSGGGLLDAMMVWNQTPSAPENGKISLGAIAKGQIVDDSQKP